METMTGVAARLNTLTTNRGAVERADPLSTERYSNVAMEGFICLPMFREDGVEMRPAVTLCAFLILVIPLLGVPGTDTPSEWDIDIIPDNGKDASVAPTAVLIARPDEADVDEEIFLDATDSVAGSGTKMWFRFHAGDGTPATDWMSVGIWSHSYAKKGEFRARVEVRNENDEVSETSVKIKIGHDDEALLFGLSAMSLILIVVIAALVLGLLALVLRRRKKAASEPYYDPYAARYASANGEEGRPADDDLPEDFHPREEYPEEEMPEEETPEEVHEAVAARPPVKRKVKRPVKKPVAAAPPAEPAMKTLMVNCPNCENNMEIKYIGPPVFLTCDKCGMKGEIPEEMLD